MGPVELASCAFGQSSKISYMEMAAAVCAVVNGGKLMQPYLVSDILNPDGSVLQHIDPVCRRQVIRPETSRIMRAFPAWCTSSIRRWCSSAAASPRRKRC